MKILAVLKKSYSAKYFFRMVPFLEKGGVYVDLVSIYDYLNINQEDYDILIYNTFPDESSKRKYKYSFIKETDKKFFSFKKSKILFDTHDRGTLDGFLRFNDLNTPRIKTNPGYSFMSRCKALFPIPFIVYPIYQNPEKDRIYKVVSAMRVENMPRMRRDVLDRIKMFNPISDWLGPREHAKRLCSTLINIVPNGTGDSCRSHTDTLASGAILLAEESIKEIKILPFADLEDGVNFVSFNIDNICDKIEWLLNDKEEAERIRLSGLETFCRGYDFEKSSNQFLNFIRKECTL